MNLRFYYFASVFLILGMLMTLMISFVSLFMNIPILSPVSIKSWEVVLLLILTGGAVFELKYFWSKGYDTAFFIILFVSLFNIVPGFLNLIGAQVQLNLPLIFVVGSHLFVSLCLIKGPPKERFWLKTAGKVMLVYVVLLFIRMFVYRLFTNYHEWGFIVNFYMWVDMVALVIPVFFLLNYRSEIKALREEQQGYRLSWHLISLGLIALIVTVTLQLKVDTPNQEEFAERDKLATSVAPDYEAHTFIGKEGQPLPYRLLKPNNYDPEKEYPLVISLHGGGIKTTDNITPVQRTWMARLYGQDTIRRDYPAFVFVPNCPPGWNWGGLPNPAESAADLVFETIEDLEKQWSIDGNRRYVIGQSMGGYGALNFAATRPEKIAAAVSVNGGGRPEIAPNARDVPIWVFHGEEDIRVPVEFSRDFIEALERAGGSPKYTVFPGEGHIFSKPLIDIPELMDWVFAQRKE